MKIDTTYNRETIKNRMLRRISALWDMSSVEHMDPIVGVMIEALSEEIFMVAEQLSHTDDRLLSKLTVALTPAHLLTACPAHAIVSIQPEENNLVATCDTVLSYKDQVFLQKYNLGSVSFSPLFPLKLVKANIKYAVIDRCLYSIDNRHSRHMLICASERSPVFNNAVWIGIETDETICEIESLPVYFDFLNVEDKERYLPLLPLTKWSHNSKELHITAGVTDIESSSEEYTLSATEGLIAEMASAYQRHYLTLSGRIDTAAEGAKNILPEDIEQLFPPETAAMVSNKSVWLKVEFPHSIPSAVLESLRIGLNLLPVLNCAQRSASMKMDSTPLFMPLPNDNYEHFLDVESVTDTMGKRYEPFSTGEYDRADSSKGVYYLRRGGVEQFSSTNDARSTIMRLMDILRDTSLMSNNKAGRELGASIDSLSITVDDITKRLSTLTGTAEPKSYIAVDKTTFGETLTVAYRTTNASIANQLRAGTVLTIESSNDKHIGRNIFLLTPPRWGQAPPSSEKVRDIHRYMITSHNRIVTREDVVNFCKAEYGTYLEKIEIQSGYGISPHPDKGLVRTIDLHIQLKSSLANTLSLPEWKHELISKLEHRSPESFNYRLYIN